ncbi:hypothetical protein CLF_100612 [Clonorchis sinensis]|uniref:Uncharacterized protein n=1 Tax=Clonorchis sinensis TaxID=79923 RepID=G7Y3U8_CLOSI|nr:hypothetical protein CLF_100612 [Clonorchis sinensis]
MNRVVDKLRGTGPRKAKAIFKQLIIQRRILLRQGSKPANDGLPLVVEDAAPQPRWRLRNTDVGICVLCDRPTTTSERWCATDGVSYHTDSCASEPCPPCGDALQISHKGVSGQMNALHEEIHVPPGRTYVLIQTANASQLFMSSVVILVSAERQPLKDKNKTCPGNLDKSLDPMYQSVNP